MVNMGVVRAMGERSPRKTVYPKHLSEQSRMALTISDQALSYEMCRGFVMNYIQNCVLQSPVLMHEWSSSFN
jgi:hypothetical protein